MMTTLVRTGRGGQAEPVREKQKPKSPRVGAQQQNKNLVAASPGEFFGVLYNYGKSHAKED